MDVLPDWLSAVAAILALVVAGFAGMQARRLTAIEADRDRRSQADLVASWCAWFPSGDRTGRDGLVIRNASSVPIYDVVVRSQDHRSASRAPATLTILPPGEFVLFPDPRFHWSFPVPLSSAGGSSRPISKHEGWKVTSMEFDDAQGTRWSRSGSVLTRVTGRTRPARRRATGSVGASA